MKKEKFLEEVDDALDQIDVCIKGIGQNTRLVFGDYGKRPSKRVVKNMLIGLNFLTFVANNIDIGLRNYCVGSLGVDEGELI